MVFNGAVGCLMESFLLLFHSFSHYWFVHPLGAAVTWYLFSMAMIVIHECGHYLVADLWGHRSLIFSVGIGPHLSFKTSSGMLFRLGFIPHSGFVRIEYRGVITRLRMITVFLAGWFYELIFSLFIYFLFFMPFWGWGFENTDFISFLMIYNLIVRLIPDSRFSDSAQILSLIFLGEFHVKRSQQA
jgi:hypothetical protein